MNRLNSTLYKPPIKECVMETRLLLNIIRTRINMCGNNPTEKQILEEIKNALDRLMEYEKKSK